SSAKLISQQPLGRKGDVRISRSFVGAAAQYRLTGKSGTSHFGSVGNAHEVGIAAIEGHVKYFTVKQRLIGRRFAEIDRSGGLLTFDVFGGYGEYMRAVRYVIV